MPIDRRRFLGALAAAPAALAGCSVASAGQARPGPRPGAAEDAGRGGAERAAASPRLAAVRTFALPAAAEPAFTFRASLVRAGEP